MAESASRKPQGSGSVVTRVNSDGTESVYGTRYYDGQGRMIGTGNSPTDAGSLQGYFRTMESRRKANNPVYKMFGTTA